ncbi:N,N'-diacetyllegionaminate synthase [Anaeromicropila populeti]|uniref:N,N'-diacetyllegionaminate synthase n=2 Tax=Anaeromicropila populeti TaxID=37658 RepID=A0A1I6HW09_9FIRM|nr:N,N'-diacetyllegionaminate synthase [Anaeromicropila populeti]
MNHKINVGTKEIGGEKTFVIAEIGSNHNQSLEKAKEMMLAARECGADAVKFQSIKPDKLYHMDKLSNDEKKLMKQIELKEEWYRELFSLAEKAGIICTSAPTYLEAVDLLVQYGVPILKIASPQVYGFPQLIQRADKANVPMILSTGYCGYKEIERAVNCCSNKSKLVLLHCTANYPTAPNDVNLNFMTTLQNMFGTIVGYSDHTLGYHIPIAAVAKGAKVIEKHFTLSRSEEGPDHFFAIEPGEFKEMVSAIRETEEALGDSGKPQLTEFERDFRKKIEMRLFASRSIMTGEEIHSDDLVFLRGSEEAVSAWDVNLVLGKKAGQYIEKGEPIYGKYLID